jgi:Transposase
MRNHPDIEYVVRDRDGLYAEGATKGAPQAKQVAGPLPSASEPPQDDRGRIGRNPGADRRCRQTTVPHYIGVRGLSRPAMDRGMHPRSYLLAEVRELGFTGCPARLYAFLSPWRQADVSGSTPEPRGTHRDAAPLETPGSSQPPVMPRDPSTGGLISSIVAAALCVKPRGMLTESQKAKVAVLKSSLPSFAAMRALAMRFRGMMRSGKADGLEAWLRDAVGSGIYGMRVFARGLQNDLVAVRNALATKWSSGQVEGQINRLKTLTRAMYGRVRVEILRARLLSVPHF